MVESKKEESVFVQSDSVIEVVGVAELSSVEGNEDKEEDRDDKEEDKEVEEDLLGSCDEREIPFLLAPHSLQFPPSTKAT